MKAQNYQNWFTFISTGRASRKSRGILIVIRTLKLCKIKLIRIFITLKAETLPGRYSQKVHDFFSVCKRAITENVKWKSFESVRKDVMFFPRIMTDYGPVHLLSGNIKIVCQFYLNMYVLRLRYQVQVTLNKRSIRWTSGG